MNYLNKIKVGDVVPYDVNDVPAGDIPHCFEQIGGIKITSESLRNKCTDCNRDYDTDDRLDALNANLLTLIDKLDQIINED